jgi:hypothetical protein
MRLVGGGFGLELAVMVTVFQIRERLLDFLAAFDEANALNSFEEWLATSTWNMHQDSEISAQKMASDIGLYLAEFDSGQIDKSGFKSELVDLLSAVSIGLSFEPVVSQGTSSVFSLNQELGALLAGKSPLAASASPVHR